MYYVQAFDRDDKHHNKTQVFGNDSGWKFSRAVHFELVTVWVWFVPYELEHYERQMECAWIAQYANSRGD